MKSLNLINYHSLDSDQVIKWPICVVIHKIHSEYPLKRHQYWPNCPRHEGILNTECISYYFMQVEPFKEQIQSRCHKRVKWRHELEVVPPFFLFNFLNQFLRFANMCLIFPVNFVSFWQIFSHFVHTFVCVRHISVLICDQLPSH